MHSVESLTRQLAGTVVEVLPNTGLAYVADAHGVVWTVTRSTRCTEGASLAGLRCGQRLALTIVTIGREPLVGHYAPLPG